jgi:hypothetical protein
MPGIDLCLAESRQLRLVRRVLPTGVLASGALLAPAVPESLVPLSAAAFLLWRALGAVDPAGWRLTWREGAGWTLGDADAACAIRLEVLACFTSALWLRVVGTGASARSASPGRPVCVMADALADDDWRRLRRRLRLDAETASSCA